MIYEFIFNHKVYAIKREINFNISDAVNEEVVLFRDLDNAQSFFRSITHDQLASEDLLQIARRLGVTNSGSAPQTTQAVFEKLCLKVFYGEFVLVEIKPVPVIWYKKCCIKSFKNISKILKNAKFLDVAIVASRLLTLLAYPFGTPPIASPTSTLISFTGVDPRKISGEEWKRLAEAIVVLPKIKRREIFDIAQVEIIYHTEDNNQDLRNFWEGIRNAFE